MFGLKKKKIDKNLYAPVQGECIPLEEVNDQVFASKMMGDGFAVKPDEDMIYSPADGEITMIFPTNHAYMITTADGKEVLVHIGIDTVQLNGSGFQALKKTGVKVRAGEEIITFAREKIAIEYDVTIMVIVTNGISGHLDPNKFHKKVSTKDQIMMFE